MEMYISSGPSGKQLRHQTCVTVAVSDIKQLAHQKRYWLAGCRFK
jgi:hypothetical protein